MFSPESVPGDLRLRKDTESLSLGDEVETGRAIIRQKTCSYVSPSLDGILRRRKMKNIAAPRMYSLLDLFHTTNSHMQNWNTGAFTAHANTYPCPSLPPSNQLGMESPFFSIYYTYSAFWMLPSVFHN